MDQDVVIKSIQETLKTTMLKTAADTVEVFMPADFSAFNGHFPNHPVLPGVTHVELCLLVAEQLCGRKFRLKQLVKAKFSQLVLPDSRLYVKMTQGDDFFDFEVNSEAGKTVANLKLIIE